MKKIYVKYINEYRVERAPLNKGSWANYDLCYNLLEKDGYKELIVEEEPSADKPYIKYREDNNKVYQYAEAAKIPEPINPEYTPELKRLDRNTRLSWYDWTVLPDSPLTEKEKAEYIEYRKFLRDWTKQDDWVKKEIPSFEEWLANKE